MTIAERKEKHYKALELLEMIESIQKRIELLNDDNNSNLPLLKQRGMNLVEKYNKLALGGDIE
jgi:hypothetical protein